MIVARCTRSILAAAFFLVSCLELSATQDSTPPPSGSENSSPSSSPAKHFGKKYSHQNDFLIHGTVFNERALAFPGVELKIRRVGEKKFPRDTYTNSRGEFAIRVPQGAEYEIVVRRKGFAPQVRTVNAKDNGSDEVLVFRMTLQKEGEQ
jgi:hypothetical protein